MPEIYRDEFPTDARARVEAERSRAYRALEQDAPGIERWRRDVPFIRCVMRVFLAFAGEACKYAKESHHPAWSDRELDLRCRDFLLSIVIDAWEDKGKDLGVSKMASSRGWGYSIDDDAKQKIEKSPEWRQYEDLLLKALEAQSVRAEDCNLPRAEQTGHAPRTCGALAAQPATKSSTNDVKSFELAEGVDTRAQAGLPTPASKRRRNSKYEKIDVVLQTIAESRPMSHEDVFRALDGRAPVPDAYPFGDTRSWLAGFKRDPVRARAWLSKSWSRLRLPAFPRGPK